jgi:mono/diheme cytochrome c family protein
MNQHLQCSFFLVVAGIIISLPLCASSAAVKAKATDRDAAAAAASFETIVSVLRNPRCMNCHSSGDYPRQGDDMHRHIMDVRRGSDGHGVNAVKCSTCHQDHNLPGIHTPPGAPDWGLPPPETPMIWEGLSDHQLCELLKDPRQNGHRSVTQIVEHMHTPLVLWGWRPGDGRTPIPSSQKFFLSAVERWASLGAACPVETIR